MHILIIEDSPADQRILQEAFKRVDAEVEFTIFESADEALRFMKEEKNQNGPGKPHFIILDLNLPGKSGKEFLQELKAEKALKRIPVLVLTSSHAEKDINDCYDLGASCYLEKPMRYKDLFKMVEAVCKFWAIEVTYSHKSGLPSAPRIKFPELPPQ